MQQYLLPKGGRKKTTCTPPQPSVPCGVSHVRDLRLEIWSCTYLSDLSSGSQLRNPTLLKEHRKKGVDEGNNGHGLDKGSNSNIRRNNVV